MLKRFEVYKNLSVPRPFTVVILGHTDVKQDYMYRYV